MVYFIAPIEILLINPLVVRACKPSIFTRTVFYFINIKLAKDMYYLCYAKTNCMISKSPKSLFGMSNVTGSELHFHAALAPTNKPAPNKTGAVKQTRIVASVRCWNSVRRQADKGVTMLSMNSGPLGNVVPINQQGSEIGSLILRTASELAKCEREEIESIVRRSLADASTIECAEQAGWFLLANSGALTDVFHSTASSTFLITILRGGLQQLPWCLSQLNAGRPVLLYDTANLFPAAEVDQIFLKAAAVRSLALVPSDSAALGRTVLILSSNSMAIEWSDGIVEQCTLLEDIFSNAYQRGLAQDESRVNIRCFHRLFAASISAMAILNRRGQFIASNASLRSVLGYSEIELQGLTFDEISGSQSRRDTAASVKNSSDRAAASRYEQTLIGKDETLIPARVTSNIIERFISGDYFLLVSIEDLTGQKAKEAELSRRQTEVNFLASLLIQSQENERKSLSRELHDDIGQRLSLAASEVALMASEQAATTFLSVNRLEGLRDELDSLCTDIHEMSHDLHSYKLQHLGLKSALKDLCRRLSQPNFRVDLYADELEEPTSKDVALCLYRVAQESLNNALKHAHAPVVALTITKLQNVFYLTIQDSGIGFDSSIHQHGLGLISMGERIKLVNGNFRMHSMPGRGTEIWIAVPDQSQPSARGSFMPEVKTAQLLDIGTLRATA
jgi:PAS domain S-box-containing protein